MLSPRSSAASSNSCGVLMPGVILYWSMLVPPDDSDDESGASSLSENTSFGRTGTGNSAPVTMLSAVTYLGVSG